VAQTLALAGVDNDTTQDRFVFEHGTDRIALSSAVFTALGSHLEDGVLGFGTEATSATEHLIYDHETGALFYDADGVGGELAHQIATLTNRPTLALADLMLV